MKKLMMAVMLAGAVTCAGETLFPIEGVKIPKGGGYVDTGYRIGSNGNDPKVTMRVKLTSEWTELDLFGTKKAEAGCFILNIGNKYFYLRYGVSNSTMSEQCLGASYKNGANTIECDATVKTNGATVFTAGSTGTFENNTYNMTFPGMRSGKQKQDFMVYSFKIEEGGSVVRDMTPCAKENGEVGFYDSVTGAFYGNSGTGEFAEVGLTNHTCRWTGAAGDGKWSNRGNWENFIRPITNNDDTVYISAAGCNGVMTNDMDFVVLKHLEVEGSEKVYLRGKEITMSASTDSKAMMMLVLAPLECDADLTFRISGNTLNGWLTTVGETVFNGAINTPDDRTLNIYSRKLDSHPVTFNGPVTGVRFTIQPSAQGTMYFNNRVSATKYISGGTEGDSQMGSSYIYEPWTYGDRMIVHGRALYCMAPQLLDKDGDLTFEGYPSGGIDLNGYDQTVCCVTGELYTTYSSGNKVYATANSRYISSSKPAMLTMLADGDAESCAAMLGHVSLTYAPLSDAYTQTFSHRTNTTDGVLMISNGTVRLSHGANFRNVPAIWIGANGRLVIDGEGAAANPFPALETLEIEEGGKIAIPAGVAMTANRVYYGNEVQSDDTYTGSGSTGTTAGWIEGAGSILAQTRTGMTEWKRKGEGSWNAAANWSEGVPTADKEAVIGGLVGGSTTVKVDAAANTATNLTMEMEGLGGAKLEVSDVLPFNRAWLKFGKGAKVEVKSGGRVNYAGEVGLEGAQSGRELIKFVDGAEMTVKAGGAFAITNIQGYCSIGGTTAGSTGRVTIEEGGEFSITEGITNGALRVMNGGELDVRGRCVVGRPFGNYGGTVLEVQCGKVDVSGNGAIELTSIDKSKGANVYVTGGEMTLSGHGTLATIGPSDWAQNITFRPYSESEPATVTFTGESCISNKFSALYVGNSVKGNVYLDMRNTSRGFSPATNNMYKLVVGNDFGDAKFDFGGERLEMTLYGTQIGFSANTSADRYGSGEMTVMNGAKVFSSGSTAVTRSSVGDLTKPLTVFYGTLVGYWMNAPDFTTMPTPVRAQKGLLRIRDEASAYETSSGHFVVGAGRAEGVVIQEDGTNLVGTSTWVSTGNKDADGNVIAVSTTNNVMAVGAYGGYGEYVISNGYFQSKLRTFIGGIHTNDYFDGAYFYMGKNKFLADVTTAEGVFRAVGGKVEFTRDVLVGANGTGTMEFGPNAEVSGTTLVLSNQTSSAINFKLDANGYGGSVHFNRLVCTDGAAMEVDIGAYCGEHPRYTLARFDAIEGTLPTVEVTGDEGNPKLANAYAEVVGGRVMLVNPHGLRIIIR